MLLFATWSRSSRPWIIHAFQGAQTMSSWNEGTKELQHEQFCQYEQHTTTSHNTFFRKFKLQVSGSESIWPKVTWPARIQEETSHTVTLCVASWLLTSTWLHLRYQLTFMHIASEKWPPRFRIQYALRIQVMLSYQLSSLVWTGLPTWQHQRSKISAWSTPWKW